MIKRHKQMLDTFKEALRYNKEYQETYAIWEELNKNNYSETFRTRLFEFFWYIYIEEKK